MNSNTLEQSILLIQRHPDLSETLLDSIIESITHPFLIIDVQTYTIDVLNDAARKMGAQKGYPCYSQLYAFSKPCHENNLEF